MALLRVLDKKYGDKTLTFTKDREQSVIDAKETFDEYKNKGWLAFQVTKDVAQGHAKNEGEQIDEFKEDYEHIMMMPPMAGGC